MKLHFLSRSLLTLSLLAGGLGLAACGGSEHTNQGGLSGSAIDLEVEEADDAESEVESVEADTEPGEPVEAVGADDSADGPAVDPIESRYAQELRNNFESIRIWEANVLELAQGAEAKPELACGETFEQMAMAGSSIGDDLAPIQAVMTVDGDHQTMITSIANMAEALGSACENTDEALPTILENSESLTSSVDALEAYANEILMSETH